MSKNKMDAEFGGKFDHIVIENEFDVYWDRIYITSVMYRNPATIVFWSDGTKTVSRCHGLDKYNPEMGLLICCMKKLHGVDQIRNLLKDWVPEKSYTENTSISLKELRRKNKQAAN